MTGRLEFRLLNYFLLITMAAVMIGIEFYFEMRSPALQQGLCSACVAPDSSGLAPLNDLRTKIVVMFGVLTLVVAIVLLMFIRNITQPLLRMAAVASRINEGDLSQVVEVETNDEIGLVGSTINELTSNLQEVAAFTSLTAGNAQEQLERLRERLTAGEALTPEDLEVAMQEVGSLLEFVDSFTLLVNEAEGTGHDV